MRDTNNSPDDEPEDDGDDRIILARAKGAFWLLEGERYLNAMLLGREPYPTPVHCIEFQSASDLNLFLLSEGLALTACWGVNPAIIDRLQRRDELVAVSPPDTE